MSDYQAYKIKLADEAESKEAQELLFELGYKWDSCGKVLSYLDAKHLIAETDGILLRVHNDNMEFYNRDANQEITLPQLRDLVVLHLNDVGDATHTNKNNDGEFLFKSSDNKLYYFNTILSQWQAMWGAEPDNAINECAVLIAKQKEQPQMTWQDAFQAMIDGKDVEMLDRHNQWESIKGFYMCSILEPNSKFRLAPQTVHLEEDDYTKEQLLKIAGDME